MYLLKMFVLMGSAIYLPWLFALWCHISSADKTCQLSYAVTDTFKGADTFLTATDFT